MTWWDRLLVALAGRVMVALARRFSTDAQRVWWINITTMHPRAVVWVGGAPDVWPPELQAGQVNVAFGNPAEPGKMAGPPPFLTVAFTREMLDMLVDGAVEVRNRQDIQLKAMGGKP